MLYFYRLYRLLTALTDIVMRLIKGENMRNLTLLTDLYELTMMQGYYRDMDLNETVVFDAFFRSNPDGNGYSICAGLEQVIDYMKNLHFGDGGNLLSERPRHLSRTISWIT
jgi:nicotinic acid phosphoribosyltransferase